MRLHCMAITLACILNPGNPGLVGCPEEFLRFTGDQVVGDAEGRSVCGQDLPLLQIRACVDEVIIAGYSHHRKDQRIILKLWGGQGDLVDFIAAAVVVTQGQNNIP